jgi:hypothetical protein
VVVLHHAPDGLPYRLGRLAGEGVVEVLGLAVLVGLPVLAQVEDNRRVCRRP